MLVLRFKKKSDRIDIIEFYIHNQGDELNSTDSIDISMGGTGWAGYLASIWKCKQIIEGAVLSGKFTKEILNKMLPQFEVRKLFPHLAERSDGPLSVRDIWLKSVVSSNQPQRMVLQVDSDTGMVPWEYGDLSENEYFFSRHILTRLPSGISYTKLKKLASSDNINFNRGIRIFPVLADVGEVKYFSETKKFIDKMTSDLGQEYFDDDYNNSYTLFLKSFCSYPVVHLICHGPGLENSSNAIQVDHRFIPVRDFINNLIEQYVIRNEFPALLILSVCGGGSAITPDLIAELFERTSVSNIIVSFFSIPVNNTTFDFYTELYRNIIHKGMAVSEAFHKAVNDPFNPIGAIHQLWGNPDVKFTRMTAVDQNTAVKVHDTATASISDAIMANKVMDLMKSNSFDEASAVIDGINDDETQQKLRSMSSNLEADVAELLDKARLSSRDVYTNIFKEGSIIDGIAELGLWPDGEIYHIACGFYDYINKEKSIRIRIPEDQSSQNIERFSSLVNSDSYNSAAGLEKYYYCSDYRLFGENFSIFYICGEMPVGENINSDSLKEILQGMSPEEKIGIAVKTASDLCSAMNLFHKNDLYFQTIEPSKVYINLNGPSAESIYIADAMFCAVTEDKISGLPENDECISDRLIVSNMMDVAGIVFHDILGYEGDLGSPLKPGVALVIDDHRNLIRCYFMNEEGYDRVISDRRFHALLKLTDCRKASRYRSAGEAAIILKGGNTVFINEMKETVMAGSRLLYLMDRYEDPVTVDDICNNFGRTVLLDELLKKGSDMASPKVVIVNAMNRHDFYRCLEPSKTSGDPFFIVLLKSGINIMILDINDVFDVDEKAVRYYHFFMTYMKRYLEQPSRPSVVMLYSNAVYSFFKDKNLLKHMKILFNSPYDIHDYYREIHNSSLASEIQLDENEINEIAANCIGLTLREVKYAMGYILSCDLMNSVSGDGFKSYLNEYRMKTMLSGSRILRLYTPKDDVYGGYHGLDDFITSVRISLDYNFSINFKSSIFTGFSGTGKKSAVSYLVKRLEIPAVSLDISEIFANGLDSNPVGLLRYALALVKQMQPCILIINRFIKDIIVASENSSALKLIMGTLLTWLQDIGNTNILVFAHDSVNSIADAESLNHEFTRSGRFTEKFFFNYPSIDSEKEILGLYAGSLGVKISDEEAVAVLSEEQMSGCLTPADIRYTMNETALRYIKNENGTVPDLFRGVVKRGLYLRSDRNYNAALAGRMKDSGYTILN